LNTPYRTGIGFDVHAFVENRKLIIGGVEIPFEKGLEGHSDADVLLHAICDALLGSIAAGDIGLHFPDTDSKYKNASSLELLKAVNELVLRVGYSVGNIDSVITAQRPKLSGYILQMRKKIADVLHTDFENISIKATTTEKLGFVGREEGISAFASVLLIKNTPNV
jgi:2-C-methyl-D-erythritol 2,4-cyclodiphosphate synthase